MKDFLLDDAYAEAVYAGALGKIIGVYAGRPFEGWAHEQITARFGEIDRYVAAEMGVPLVVTDDDISGTFTFLRALADQQDNPELTAEQIGQCWQNYIIEGRTILWWGGLGMSTEHTAFLRMQEGVPAPRSGSIELNGKTVAEQIGAQIFIDGWGLICPGDPVLAASFARRAASVSHDGEAIYAAQVVAALVANAFVEKNIDKLLDTATSLIPSDSVIAQVIRDVRSWRDIGHDWKAAFQLLKTNHGYERYPSNCHVVPNHGVVILALIYGEGNFAKSLMIANTCGWDTDCNSGNVCCIVGVISGLKGINADYDWRTPIRDELYLPTADGGRCVSDAVQESLEIVRMANAIRGKPASTPRERFSFCFPGSQQGFRADGLELSNQHRRLTMTLLDQEGSAMTATIPPKDLRDSTFYSAMFSPTLSSGQTVKARIHSNQRVRAQLVAEIPIEGQATEQVGCEWITLAPGHAEEISFQIPQIGGPCISRIGLNITGMPGDQIEMEWLTWDGCPSVTLKKTPGDLWLKCWANGVSSFDEYRNGYSLIQNHGTGLVIYGCREWTDYEAEAAVTIYLADAVGIAVRVQGMKRFYALLITSENKLQLIRGGFPDRILAERSFSFMPDDKVKLRLSVEGNRLSGKVNGEIVLVADDFDAPLLNGAAGIVLTKGRCSFEAFAIKPITTDGTVADHADPSEITESSNQSSSGMS